MDKPKPFNPLDRPNLGKSIVDALLLAPARPLVGLSSFYGAGVYALYYHGPFAAYQKLTEANGSECSFPIYVGKGVPKGARKGLVTDASAESKGIYDRLKEHRESIQDVDSLDVKDFSFRVLVVDDIWISLGETLLIQRFRPIWNQVVDGFGNHTPGEGRFNGKRPLWDELHPGRAWAFKCRPPGKSRDEILQLVEAYMQQTLGPPM